jgi:hypothetical protein
MNKNSVKSSNEIPLNRNSEASIDIDYIEKLNKLNHRNSYEFSYDSNNEQYQNQDNLNTEKLKKKENILVSKFEIESSKSKSKSSSCSYSSSKSSNLLLDKKIDNITNEYGYNWITIRALIACILIDYYLSLIIFHNTSYIKILEKIFFDFEILKKINLGILLSLIGFFIYGLGSFSLMFIAKFFPQSRRLIIFFSLIMIFFSCLLNSIYFNFYTYLIFLILGYFFSGLAYPINSNILCESLPLKSRGFIFCLSHIGKPIAKFTHYFLIKIIYNEKEVNSINIIMGICTGVLFISGSLGIILLRNSPRNLIITNDSEASFEILNKMLRENKALKNHDKNIIIKEMNKGINDKSIRNISELFGKIFINPTLIFTAIIFLIKFFENGFYSILIYYIKDSIINKSPSANIENENIIFEDMKFIIIILSVFGIIFSGILIEIIHIGRKFTLLSSIFLLLLSYFLLQINPTNIKIWIGFTSILTDISYYCLITLITETYSTVIRDIAMGFIHLIIAISSGFGILAFIGLYNLSKIGPFYFQIASSIINIFLISLVSYETCNKNLDDFTNYNYNNTDTDNELIVENDIENEKLNLKSNQNLNDSYIDNIKYQ